MIRVPLRSFATLVLALAVSTCSDAPTGAPTPAKSTGPAHLALAATFSKSAAAVYSQRNEFADVSFDHVRIILRSTARDTIVKDTTIVFTPTSGDVTLDFTINGASPGDVFGVELQFLNGSIAVYKGTGNAQAYAPEGTPPTPKPIVVVYVGPGANATRISVAPKSIAIVAPSSATFTVTAVDANNAPVANLPVSWTTSDPSIAIISSSGLLTTTGKRGSVTVIATSVTGLTDNATATVSLPPSAIVLVSGGGQTGKAGSTLPQAAVVKVTASDGVGVVGANVNFSAPPGGKVGSTSVATDVNGLASTSLTLGSAAGSQGFAATTAGLSVGIPETAIAADANLIAAVSGSSQTDTVKHALKNPFVAKVSDQFGNPVGGVTVTWTRTTGSGTLTSTSTVTGIDGTTSVGYTLGATSGTETIVASIGGGSSSATFIATAVTGPASAIAIVSGNTQTGGTGALLAAPLIVKITDGAGNPVGGAAVAWVATNGTLSATTTSDLAGLSSNALTLGTTVGSATATATIGSGSSAKSVTFTATVTGGAANKLQFAATPPTAVIGAVLSPPIVVNLLDALGNPSAGTNPVTIALGNNPGEATLGGTLTRNAVNGVATFNDLTVSNAAVGYTLVATSPGLATATSNAFTIIASGTSRTWTGAVSTDWANAGNWSGGLPGPTSVVTIPSGTTNAPALTANVSIASLTVATGGSLSLGTFTLTSSGNVDGGSGPGITGSGAIVLPSTSTIRGVLSNVIITGAVTQAGAVTASGGVDVQAGGTLTVSTSMTVAGSVTAGGTSAQTPARLIVASGGALTAGTLSISGASGLFSQTGGTAVVTGTATFGGNNTTGLITAGTLSISVDFVQTGAVSAASFVATGTHTVVLNGSGAQNLNLANSPTSHFQNLSLAGTGAVTLGGGPLSIGGQLISPTGATTLNAGGRSITTAGFDVDGLTINNGLLVSTGGTITRFDNVTFQGYAATATPLTISHPGAAAPFTFNNTQFLVTPTSGYYINATDSNTGDGTVLTINMVSSVPADGSAATLTAGGAIVSWGGAPGPNAWTNSSGGLWSTASNWSRGRAPALGDSVIITLPGTYTVSLDVSPEVTYITLGGTSGVQTLSLGTSVVTLDNVLTVGTNGVFSFNGGAIGGPGSAVNKGEIDITNGAFALNTANQGTIVSNGTVQLNGTLTTAVGSILRVSPTGVTGFAGLSTSVGFTNNGLIELTSSTASAAQLSVAGVLTNAAGATINSLPGLGGTRSITAFGGLTNQGTIGVSQALSITVPGGLTNSAQMTLNADLSVILTGGDFTNNGVVTTAAGTTLSVNGGSVANFNVSAAGSLGGSGAISLINVHGGAIASAFTASQLSLVNSRIGIGQNLSTAAVPLTLSNSTIDGPGVITNSTGVSMSLNNSTISSTSGLINQGTVIANATSSIAGPLATTAGSILRLQPDGSSGVAQLTVANGFTNNGGIELTSVGSTYNAILNVTAGTLTNTPGGTISSLAGAGGVRRIGAQLNNQGSIQINQPLTIDMASAAHTNSGTINVAGGDLTVTQSGSTPSFTNSGTVSISAGRTTTVTGGTFTETSGGTLSGGGALTLSNATAAFGSSFTLGALTLNGTTASFANNVSTTGLTLSLTNSTVNGPGTITNVAGQTLLLNNSTISNTSALINQGIVIGNATSSIAGPLTTAAGSILRLQPDGSSGVAQLTVANGFTNNGGIELTSTVSSYNAILDVTAGTLTNAAGGTISSLAGTGGGRTIGAQLDNQGSIQINQALTINQPSAAHTNSGTVNVAGGDLTVTQSGTTPSFTNNGTVSISAGRTMTATGGTFTESSGGTLNGGGALTLVSATAAFGSTFTLGALTLNTTTASFANNLSTSGLALSLTTSTINGPGTITNVAGQTLLLNNSTIGNTSALINQGIVIANAASNISGPLTTAAGSILRLQPDGSSGGSLLTVANGFTNNGGIELTSTVSSFNSILNVTAGTLTNAAGGTISALAGTGGVRRLGATVSNAGSINLTEGLSLVVTGNFTNTGTVNVGLGGLSLGSQYGQLAVAGSATLAGTLNVTTFGGFTPASSNTFSVLAYGSVSGDFATYTLPGGLAAWTPTFTSGSTLDLTKN